MARLLITDVTVTRTADTITCGIRLTGGQRQTLTLPTPKPAWLLRKTPAHVLAAVDELLNTCTHAEIADILNNRGLTSGEGRQFHRNTVARIVRDHRLRTREQRLREAGMLTLHEMAAALGVSTGTVKLWRDAGLVSGQQHNDHGQMLYHPRWTQLEAARFRRQLNYAASPIPESSGTGKLSSNS
jgi:hypothetical protein